MTYYFFLRCFLMFRASPKALAMIFAASFTEQPQAACTSLNNSFALCIAFQLASFGAVIDMYSSAVIVVGDECHSLIKKFFQI